MAPKSDDIMFLEMQTEIMLNLIIITAVPQYEIKFAEPGMPYVT